MPPPHATGASARWNLTNYLVPLQRRGRRTVLASSWFTALVVLSLLWFYFFAFDYGSDRRGLPADVLLAGKDGRPLPAVVYSNDPAKSAPTMPATTEPTVKLRQGTYVGKTLAASTRFPKAIEAFRGLPYAQDTGGPNRFGPPQPLPASSETFGAVAWGKICPNGGVVQKNMSEDCLNANIYRPADLVDLDGYEKTGEEDVGRNRPRLPVVVYVHGGGFNMGYGAERNMATFVAWADLPVVGVNFNYRVGPLGFLPSAVTAREGLLNLGLRDQQMMFEWVRDNIEAFGGDPRNVTIMGLSAGAHSIGHHIMHYSRSSKPAPFVKAILESGATTARAVFYPTHPRHLVQFREFLLAAGVAGVAESDIFPHLRTLPLETIARAAKIVWDRHTANVTWPFQPVIDGPHALANSSSTLNTSTTLPPLIPDLPINSWQAGHHLRIPIITGFNTNEGTVFIPPKANTAADFRAFFQKLIPSLTPPDLDELETLYPDPVTNSSSPYRKVPRGMGRQWARLDAAYAHYAYICPVLQTAHYLSRANGASSSLGRSRVYVYRYAATALYGAANHADETPAVAHDLDPEFQGMPGLAAVAGEMHGAWARFVAGVVGSPNEGSKHHPSSAPHRRDGGGDGKDGGEKKKGGKGEEAVLWPAFVSPFEDGLGRGKGAANVDGGEAGVGKIMVFGEGNDERGGGKNKGVPAQVVEMTALEREACRFWWARIGLSQGMGRRELPGEKGRVGSKL